MSFFENKNNDKETTLGMGMSDNFGPSSLAEQTDELWSKLSSLFVSVTAAMHGGLPKHFLKSVSCFDWAWACFNKSWTADFQQRGKTILSFKICLSRLRTMISQSQVLNHEVQFAKQKHNFIDSCMMFIRHSAAH